VIEIFSGEKNDEDDPNPTQRQRLFFSDSLTTQTSLNATPDANSTPLTYLTEIAASSSQSKRQIISSG